MHARVAAAVRREVKQRRLRLKMTKNIKQLFFYEDVAFFSLIFIAPNPRSHQFLIRRQSKLVPKVNRIIRVTVVKY